MCDVTDRAASVLQMDIKITHCYAVVEATDRAICTASCKSVFLLSVWCCVVQCGTVYLMVWYLSWLALSIGRLAT